MKKNTTLLGSFLLTALMSLPLSLSAEEASAPAAETATEEAAKITLIKPEEPMVTMTVEAFMEDYAKPASKLAKKGNTEPVLKVMEAIPAMALEADKAEWQAIVDEGLKSGDIKATCKGCHKKHKKPYHKAHGDREIEVSKALIDYLKTQL